MCRDGAACCDVECLGVVVDDRDYARHKRRAFAVQRAAAVARLKTSANASARLSQSGGVVRVRVGTGLSRTSATRATKRPRSTTFSSWAKARKPATGVA